MPSPVDHHCPAYYADLLAHYNGDAKKATAKYGLTFPEAYVEKVTPPADAMYIAVVEGKTYSTRYADCLVDPRPQEA